MIITAKKIEGITVELNGNTTNLTKSMNDANRACNSLGKELSQVDRLLKLDPGNITLLKQKQDLLNQSIAQTKSKLKEMEAAQAQVETKFKNGDIDAGQYRKFQRDLEQTKQSLSGLEQEKKSVSGLGGAFTVLSGKVAEVGEKLAPVVSGVQKLGSAAGAIMNTGGKALTAYTTALTGASTAVMGLTVKSAAWADDINTIAAQTGLSTEEIQKFQYATEHIDVPLETLTGSMAKLTKNMATAQKGSGAASEAFRALGISVTDNATGELRNNQDVFNEAIAALGEMENSTQRDALAMQIFGKSAQDLNPLILGGADALKELGTSAEKAGLIMSQDGVDNLNAFNDSVDTMKANAAASGRVLSGVFSGSFKTMTDTIGAALPSLTSALADMFGGGNMDTAQQKLTSSFSGIVSSVVNLITEGAPKAIAAFNALVLGVVSSLSAALPTIASTLLSTLIQGLTRLVSGIVAQIPIVLPALIGGAVMLFSGLLDGLNKIAPQIIAMLPMLIDNMCATITANLPIIIDGGIQLLFSLIQGIADTLPKLIEQTVALFPVIITEIVNNLPKIIESGVKVLVSLITGIANSIPRLIQQVIALIPVIVTAVIQNLPLIIKAGIEILLALINGIVNCIPQLIQQVIALIPVITTSLIRHLPEIITAGIQIVIALGGGLIQAIPQLVGFLPQIISGIVNGLLSGLSSIANVGYQMVQGLWHGISDAAGWLWDMIGGFCDDIMDNIKDFFGIHSPSTKFRDEIGKNMAEGIGVGFVLQMKKVREDMEQSIPSDFSTAAKVPQSRYYGKQGTERTVPASFMQTNNYYSPRALSEAELARKTRNDTRQLILQGAR